MPTQQPLVFIIFDGWGHNPQHEHNAIAQAHTPHWDACLADYPHRLIAGSGVDVGLPDAQMGNSEVGHMHIGAGRIIEQDFTRINRAMTNGDFANNPVFVGACDTVKQQQSTLHIMGLLSPGGVHAHEDHIFALIELALAQQCPSIVVHAFLDGRDCPPQSAGDSLARLEALAKTQPSVHIGSISGRFYAMDRDARWSRTQAVFDALTATEPSDAVPLATCATDALKQAYQAGTTDEFVPPTLIVDTLENPVLHTLADNDVVISMNFRADRIRQLTRALIAPADAFTGFARQRLVQLADFVSLTEYASDLPTRIAFAPIPLTNMLGEVLANAGCRQLRVAETEKYAHVTFFFNGGREQPFANEKRQLIPSLRDVATYDEKPAMSAAAITDVIVEALNTGSADVIIANFANPDMVGHTGNFAATVQAIEVIDTCLGRILEALSSADGDCLITSDHGNAEKMFDPETGQAHTAHTNLPVPLVLVGNRQRMRAHPQFDDAPAGLADLAPTLLALLDIAIPQQMTGRVLVHTASATATQGKSQSNAKL